MLVIRLSRTGKPRQPSFRLIIQEKTSSPKRNFLEILGNYNPALPSKPLVLKEERIKYWISVGAIPSDSVAMLLKKKGFSGMERFIEPRDKKRRKKGTKLEAKGARPTASTASSPAA